MTMLATKPFSFRDPNGQIYRYQQRILRRIAPSAVNEFHDLRQCGFIQQLIQSQRLLPESLIAPPSELVQSEQELWLEHPPLPFISYPYEWTFSALKNAAVFQLELLQDALQNNIILSDASAYNIQFIGAQPVFIDHLSFRRYESGQLWQGHRQFCQQLLYPLWLSAWCKLPYQTWYRGQPQGIANELFLPLLPWHKKCLKQPLLHSVLPHWLEKSAAATPLQKKPKLPKTTLVSMLQQLQKNIESLKPSLPSSAWQGYQKTPYFSAEQQAFKQKVVTDFIQTLKPACLLDLGCNQGEFAALALQHGANYVVGLDSDLNALEKAFQRAQDQKLAFLPIYMDLADPSPNQGFAELERLGLNQRARFDALLGLAILHHLMIGQNIPMNALCDWLTSLAPRGLIEFVPKQDPMVKSLLHYRQDIFTHYNWENFVTALEQKAMIKQITLIPDTERRLIHYEVK